jgi:hypothetical protein
MKRLSLWLRTSPLMIALLSLGIALPRSTRAVRVPITEPTTTTAATRRCLIDQPWR